MPRVAICAICGNLEMLENELIDHIEKRAHSEDFRNMDVEQYRRWFQQNIRVEDRIAPPAAQNWFRNINSLGIQTGR